MFTLFIITVFCGLWEGGENRDYAMAIILLLTTGLFVEYLWPGILLGIAVWAYFRYGNWSVILGLGIPAIVLICIINGNLWALASIAIIIVFSKIRIIFPRFRHIFYTLYPAHLTILLAVQFLTFA
jgi:hypothetical protein